MSEIPGKQATHQSMVSDRARPTGDAIVSVYKKLAQRPIQSSVLFEKLDQAEEAGLVKRGVISQDDEPVLIWKSQVPSKHTTVLKISKPYVKRKSSQT